MAAVAPRAEAPPRTAEVGEPGPHTFWLTDTLFGHAQLFDGDTGEMLATVDTGQTLSPKPPFYSRKRHEFYSVEIAYSRFRRGARTDYVTIHDAHSFAVKGEIVLPSRTSESATSIAYAALLDDERFLATFNQFPVASVSIADVEQRRFVGTIPIAGCAGIYPLGPRRFASLCGDGTMLVVSLDERGRAASTNSTAKFFDAVEDPVMMSGGRDGERWVFVSFAGMVHEVDFSETPVATTRWSLVSDAEREAGWRPGGKQHVALHADSKLLYAIMHEGEPGSHKQAGPEVWVVDLAKRERVARFEMPNFTAAFLGTTMQLGTDGFVGWLMRTLLPGGGAHSIAVTQDAQPVLLARNEQMGALAVLDARTGELLRMIGEVGLAGTRIEVVP